MFCIFCGAPNPEGASFCSSCGKNIGAPTGPSAAAEAAPAILSSAERSSGNALLQSALPISSAAEQAQRLSSPQAQYQPVIAGKGKPVLWVLAGFAACLLIVIAVALGSRLNQNSSRPEAARANAAPDAAPPTAYTAPAPAPAADTTTAPSADATTAPATAPVTPPAQPAPAAPQNPIVGDWKASTYIGTTIGLHLGADGRYVLNPGSDEGVYAYSSGDGTLRLQSNSFFSKGIMVWSCQVMGDTLSCVDADGAGHVYNRVR